MRAPSALPFLAAVGVLLGVSLPSISGTLTNVTVSVPVGTYQQGIVYAPVRTPTNASAYLAWAPNPEADLGGYRLVYGDARLGTTNIIKTQNTNLVLFTLSTNTTFYFYVTAHSTNAEASAPSSVVIYQPSK